ncbi:MAG TPA: hypothetical protein VEL74_19080, partial [Thermoanaerobaculia bacterium]|nr:hypothetical protein [Thermoanaerobaculia bacterium]
IDMAADPRAPGALWVAGGIGFFHSSDSGANWQPVNLGSEYLVIDVVKVSPRDPDVIFAAGMAVLDARPPRFEARIFRSVDGGRTWQRRDAGLPGQDIQELALDPEDPATLWASTSLDLYRSTDGGASWRRVRSALPDGVFTHLAAAPGAVYATLQGMGNDPSAVLRSTDGGETWTPLQTGLGFRIPSVLEIDPHDPDHLLLGTRGGSLLTWTEP